ncbi:MAG: ABC-three component system middle component 6 [Candidatus Paceibacterota bacterium]|jgi:hypothetical protein
MILPNKNIYLRNSLLGLGAIILEKFHRGDTVSSLWERIRSDTEINTFEKYILTLDFLYILKAVDIREGILIQYD